MCFMYRRYITCGSASSCPSAFSSSPGTSIYRHWRRRQKKRGGRKGNGDQGEICMCMTNFNFVRGCKLTSVEIKLNNQPSSCRRRPLPNCSRRDCRRNPGTWRQDGAGETSERADTAADRSYCDVVCASYQYYGKGSALLKNCPQSRPPRGSL